MRARIWLKTPNMPMKMLKEPVTILKAKHLVITLKLKKKQTIQQTDGTQSLSLLHPKSAQENAPLVKATVIRMLIVPRVSNASQEDRVKSLPCLDVLAEEQTISLGWITVTCRSLRRLLLLPQRRPQKKPLRQLKLLRNLLNL
jgi:hypothetical protein